MAISFSKKIGTVLKLVAEPRALSALLSQRYSGYLTDSGWFESFKKKTPFDKDGNPIPWFTYSCNDFLNQRLNKNLSIFEFGSGNSTLYFASKASKVVSLEHNETWYKLQKERIPENVKLIYCKQKKYSDYSHVIEKLNEKFDITIIDGIDRVNCIVNSVDFLKEGGVMILDDSERDEYKSGIEFLLGQEFKKLDFWGISAGILFKKCTTIFYRKQNCLQV